ncbi:MAG TPA: tyrosine--tRNA ligase, partial [Armatimonadota bacterium]|nr:tyrosine--tRNA ligase [Armatimonadota bacterium]
PVVPELSPPTADAMLTEDEVRRNAETYVDQVGLILDTNKCELHYNSTWFNEIGAGGLMELASHYTLARMLERDDFSKRMAANAPLSIRELLYPLVQGYDSVAIQSDVEVGGTDQTFNLLVGRDIQRSYGMEPQVVLTYSLLVGLDGKEKMSKSLGNAIGITDEPHDMFGKVMSIPDGVADDDGNLEHRFGTICHYIQSVLDWPEAEVAEHERKMEAGEIHPRVAKADLAAAVVAMHHSAEAATEARAEFDRVFAERELPSDMPEVCVLPEMAEEGAVEPIQLVRHCGFANTNGEARRLIQQGGVRINDEPIKDFGAKVALSDGDILRVGKRRFAKLRLGE